MATYSNPTLEVSLEGCKHVFIIGSPIVEITAAQFINANKIPSEDIIIIPHRLYNVSLVQGHIVHMQTNIADRLCMRFFYRNLTGIRTRLKIETRCKKFFLYVAWDFPEVVEILNSKS